MDHHHHLGGSSPAISLISLISLILCYFTIITFCSLLIIVIVFGFVLLLDLLMQVEWNGLWGGHKVLIWIMVIL